MAGHISSNSKKHPNPTRALQSWAKTSRYFLHCYFFIYFIFFQSSQAHRQPRASFDSSSSQQPSGWQGTCIHNFEIPKWVQKQRRVDPEEDLPRIYEEPRRALAVAVNGKFSLIAIGTHGSVSAMPPHFLLQFRSPIPTIVVS